MGARLYNFNGGAVIPTKVFTISLTKELSEFATFEEASATGVTDFFSIDTNSSPVPLEALKHFKLIHTEGSPTTGVKLFQVID